MAAFMNWRGFGLIAFVVAALFSLPAAAAFDAWRQDMFREAVSAGVSADVARQALTYATFDSRVIALDQRQPEGQISFARYIKSTLVSGRVQRGRALRARYASTLRVLERRYGVPGSVIVALWGIESDFGASMGWFDVISSLATLAYEGRRADFFKSELIEAMKILQEEGIPPEKLRGSWAGAMGQCQFMPSTFRRYAVDFDDDGTRDIWAQNGDSLASIAHYLSSIGWHKGESLGREVRLKKKIPASLTGLGVQKTLAEWGRLGVVSLGGKPLPASGMAASLIRPDGAGGRSFLVYDNVRAVMRWNRSTYFALAVMLLADRLSTSQ